VKWFNELIEKLLTFHTRKRVFRGTEQVEDFPFLREVAHRVQAEMSKCNLQNHRITEW